MLNAGLKFHCKKLWEPYHDHVTCTLNPVLNSHSKIGFQDRLLLNAGLKFHCKKLWEPYPDHVTCTLKPVLNGHSKIGFPDGLLLNAGLKYCRMLQESGK